MLLMQILKIFFIKWEIDKTFKKQIFYKKIEEFTWKKPIEN